jgi:hypothetical protein
MGLTNDSINSTKLLETLNGTGNEKSSLGLDAVVFQQIFPGAGTDGSFDCDCLKNGAMQLSDLDIIG